jgi:hypothetical protein
MPISASPLPVLTASDGNCDASPCGGGGDDDVAGCTAVLLRPAKATAAGTTNDTHNMSLFGATSRTTCTDGVVSSCPPSAASTRARTSEAARGRAKKGAAHTHTAAAASLDKSVAAQVRDALFTVCCPQQHAGLVTSPLCVACVAEPHSSATMIPTEWHHPVPVTHPPCHANAAAVALWLPSPSLLSPLLNV